MAAAILPILPTILLVISVHCQWQVGLDPLCEICWFYGMELNVFGTCIAIATKNWLFIKLCLRKMQAFEWSLFMLNLVFVRLARLHNVMHKFSPIGENFVFPKQENLLDCLKWISVDSAAWFIKLRWTFKGEVYKFHLWDFDTKKEKSGW